MRALGFSPSVRLFEAAACGVAIISDYWPGLESIFTPGSEILIANGTEDMIEILTGLPEERRLAIASGARNRLLKDHTPDHRALQLEGYYLEAYNSQRPHKSASLHALDTREAAT